MLVLLVVNLELKVLVYIDGNSEKILFQVKNIRLVRIMKVIGLWLQCSRVMMLIFLSRKVNSMVGLWLILFDIQLKKGWVMLFRMWLMVSVKVSVGRVRLNQFRVVLLWLKFLVMELSWVVVIRLLVVIDMNSRYISQNMGLCIILLRVQFLLLV